MNIEKAASQLRETADIIERMGAEIDTLRKDAQLAAPDTVAHLRKLESIAAMAEEYGGIDHLVKLAKAEKAGTAFFCPCKIGDVLWRYNSVGAEPCIVTAFTACKLPSGETFAELLYTFGNGLKAGIEVCKIGEAEHPFPVFLSKNEAQRAFAKHKAALGKGE